MKSPGALAKPADEQAGWRGDPQHLPVPIGGWSPAHHRVRRNWHTWRWLSMAAYLSAATLTVFSAVLTFQPMKPTMYLDSAGAHVDGLVVSPHAAARGEQLFVGSVTLLLRHSGGTVRGYAATTLDGRRAWGVCSEVGWAEQCWFRMGTVRLHSSDVYDPMRHEWSRTYSDGVRVSIAVPAGATVIPVPLPIGHH